MENRRVSKLLSLVLRHKPEVIGIVLDENGWTNVEKLLEALASKRNLYIDIDILQEIVERRIRRNLKVSKYYHKGQVDY